MGWQGRPLGSRAALFPARAGLCRRKGLRSALPNRPLPQRPGARAAARRGPGRAGLGWAGRSAPTARDAAPTRPAPPLPHPAAVRAPQRPREPPANASRAGRRALCAPRARGEPGAAPRGGSGRRSGGSCKAWRGGGGAWGGVGLPGRREGPSQPRRTMSRAARRCGHF